MNSKEENSLDFCPYYVQEFGLMGSYGESGGAHGQELLDEDQEMRKMLRN